MRVSFGCAPTVGAKEQFEDIHHGNITALIERHGAYSVISWLLTHSIQLEEELERSNDKLLRVQHEIEEVFKT